MITRTLHIVVVFLVCSLAGYAQNLDKNSRKLFRTAEEYSALGDHQNALNLYRQAYPADSTNVYMNYKIGLSMYYLKQHRTASYPYFKKAEAGKFKDCYYYLGQLEHLKLQFDDAIRYYEKYKRATGDSYFTLKDVERAISISNYAKQTIKHPLAIEIENLGEEINSQYPDYVPLITADESMLVFTSRREGSSDNNKDPNGDYFEDIYVSYFKDGKWTKPVNAGKTINTLTHDACAALSPDGQQMITYKTSDDLLSGDLYTSSFNGMEWSSPAKLPENINSKEYVEASASIASDNELIYFSSDRPGGLGGKDIYFSRRLPDNTWGKPMNLGPPLNTEYDEDAPFIHPDGKTIYFSSKGHSSIGGYDIFRSTMDEQFNWSVPENLGYPINSVNDDIYFVMSLDGKNGYYSANRTNGYGDQDIYMIKNPEQYFQLTVLKGRLMDKEQQKPVAAKISLLNKTTNTIEGVFRSNRLTGTFVLIGYPGNKYDILIESVDHQSFVQSLTFPGDDISIELSRKEIGK